MDSVKKQQLLREKRTFDFLGIKLFTGTDNEVTSFVANKLIGYKANANMALKTYQLQSALDLSYGDIKIFGEDYATKIASLIKATDCVPYFSGHLSYTSYIIYSVDEKSQKVIPESGAVHHYKVPMRISELAPIFLGHEHIHSLKETNYPEYINGQRIGDVIPLFYELVIAKKNYPEIYKIWLNARMYLMSDLKRQYMTARQMAKNEFREKDLYKLYATRTGQYLNSFYYALILYHIYLEDQNLVLGLIRKVLNHEITTLDMLNTLGIYGTSNKDIFEEELDKIKKSL